MQLKNFVNCYSCECKLQYALLCWNVESKFFLEERQLPTNKYFVMESVNKIKSLVSSQAEKTKADTFDPQFFGGW